MDRKQFWGVIVAIIIMVTIAATALFIVYSPKDEEYKGIPTFEPYVRDDASVLLSSDYSDLEEFCLAVELNNSCQVALLIVDDIGEYDLNTFALKTFEKNGIGQSGKDNGVLVVFYVTENETRWRTVTGGGVQDILSGYVLKGFENDYLIPNIDAGDLSWGITLYIYAIGLELDENYISEGSEPWESYLIWFIPLNGWQLGLAVVILVVLIIVTRGRILLFIPWMLGGGGGRFGGGGTGGGGSRGRR